MEEKGGRCSVVITEHRPPDHSMDSQSDGKSQQHPKDFPSGHPPQYYPGLATVNFGVQMGSGAFDAVWPLTRSLPW